MIQDSLRIATELYGSIPAAEFGPLKLKAVRAMMIGKEWCRTEINKKVGRVRRMFRWAVEHKIVPPDAFCFSPAEADRQRREAQLKHARRRYHAGTNPASRSWIFSA